MKGSFFIFCMFTLSVVSLVRGQQSRLARRLDSVERKLDAVLVDMVNFRTDINDIYKTSQQNQSTPTCTCSCSNTGGDNGMLENMESELDTIAANSNSIQRIYKGFKDLKETVLVATATHASKIKGVEEVLDEVKQKIEAALRFNNQHVDNQEQVMHKVKTLESEIKVLQQYDDQTDEKLHQLEVNMRTEMADKIRAAKTDMEQRLPVLCPRGWFPYLNNCYYLSDTKANWKEAIQFCKTKQAQLIEFEDTDEQQFVLRLVRSLSTWSSRDWEGFYIGGSDSRTEGTFVWESSQKVLASNNWLPGQPDNGGNYEHCMIVLVNQNGLWNDSGCTGYKKFVCKKKLPDS